MLIIYNVILSTKSMHTYNHAYIVKSLAGENDLPNNIFIILMAVSFCMPKLSLIKHSIANLSLKIFHHIPHIFATSNWLNYII